MSALGIVVAKLEEELAAKDAKIALLQEKAMTGLCSAHMKGENPDCKICYPNEAWRKAVVKENLQLQTALYEKDEQIRVLRELVLRIHSVASSEMCRRVPGWYEEIVNWANEALQSKPKMGE